MRKTHQIYPVFAPFPKLPKQRKYPFFVLCSHTNLDIGQQKRKGTVKSVLIDDELVKVNLSIYDTDGMEGLYVPRSSFRETTQDVASGAMSQSMSLNDGSATSSLGRWGMQALQNAYQKTANAISKNIRKNKVNIKYGTQVYLINSKEKRQTK